MEECKKAYLEAVNEGQRTASTWMIWQLAWFHAIRFKESQTVKLSVPKTDLY